MQLTNPRQHTFHPDEESTALLSVVWLKEGSHVFLETMVFTCDPYTETPQWKGAMRHVSLPPPDFDVRDVDVDELKLAQELEFLVAMEALPYRRNASLAECCDRVYNALEQVHA